MQLPNCSASSELDRHTRTNNQRNIATHLDSVEPTMIRRQSSEMDVRCSRFICTLCHINGILFMECVPFKEAPMNPQTIVVCWSVSTILHSLASEKNVALHKLFSVFPQALTSRVRSISSALCCGVSSLFSRSFLKSRRNSCAITESTLVFVQK